MKEIYRTLQGEGAQVGRQAVLCRFSGCNLWNGVEEARSEAVCTFCDTDFVGTDGPGGGKFEDAAALADRISAIWGDQQQMRFVVCTGGEPLLQLDEGLITALHRRGFEVAVETNGTLAAPPGIDWVCVSPKGRAPLRLTSGDEIKVVFPQTNVDPEEFVSLAFRHFFIQPMDGPMAAENRLAALEYCERNPRWRLSLQTHKLIGIP